MGLTHMLYRFMRLQRRRWEREYGRAYRRGRNSPQGRDAALAKNNKPRKERRKRDQDRSVCAKLVIAALYIATAIVLGAHLTGKRPLRILSSDRFGRMNRAASAVHDIQGLLGEARLRTARGTPPPLPPHPAAPSPHAHQQLAADNEPPAAQKDDDPPAAEKPAAEKKPPLPDAKHDDPDPAERRADEATADDPPAKPGATTPSKPADEVDSVGEEDLSGPPANTASTSDTATANGDNAGPPAAAAASSTKHHSHGGVRALADDMYTRRCYLSGVTEDSLCVHAPFCARASGLVYLAESLACAAYSNMHGIMGTISTRRCVEVERDLEHRAEIANPEHKTRDWLTGLAHDGKVQWYEGETVLMTLSAKASSVAHYAQRVFFLHHVLLHPSRYGLDRISNVVIIAEEEVARKIKFRKSWHYGLLAAIVHPNKPVFRYAENRDALNSPTPPGTLNVFVPTGLGNLAKGKQIPCFRRAAIPGALRAQYLLTQDRYPGVLTHGIDAASTSHISGKYFDGAMFRKQVYASLDRDEPPLRKRLIYLHRASGRALTAAGRATLEGALKSVSAEVSYDYAFIDLSGKTFQEQVDAVGGAGIAVGVHGMQLMATLFMPAAGALIEIFPYRFWHALYADGCGSGLSYQSLSLSKGEDHADVGKFGGLDACVSSSQACRLWYRSDDRPLALGDEDAAEVQRMVREAADGIARREAGEGVAR
jgi:hypothetical protein